MSDYKPCPFCGSSDMKLYGHGQDWKFVTCSDCGADGPEELSADDAKAGWNRRADDANRDDKDSRGSIRSSV